MVVGFGESSIDFVYVTEPLLQPGVSKARIIDHYSTCGGQVATAMAACAALGLKAGFLGPIGDDENGRRLMRELAEHGVDTSRTISRAAPSRYAIILVDRGSGERVVLWERDPRLDVPVDDLDASLLSDAQVVHVDASDETASIALARRARAAGAIVTCDVDTVTARTSELLSEVTSPILAEQIPREITGLTDPEAALRALREPHQPCLCVTLGGRGSAALDGDRFVQVPAHTVTAVDTTGAGDVFRAGFIYGLLQQWPVERTLRFANTAAALSCTRRGALPSVPSRLEVERQLR